MAQTAGYLTTVKLGGTAVAFTNEATTKITANTVYQITDTTKQIVDPATAVTVEVDADGGGGGGYASGGTEGVEWTLNYLTGTVTFTADQGAPALVRVSGAYIPLLDITSAKAAGIDCEAQELDATVFTSTGWRQVRIGLLRASGTLELLDNAATDHDPGAGTKKFSTLFTDRTKVLLEINVGAQGNKFRAWAGLTLLGADPQLDGLEQLQVGWLAAGTVANRFVQSFGFTG